MLATNAPTILVAEDDAEVRNYLEIALRHHGFAVEFAEDGEEALSWLGSNQAEAALVLLDLMMPRKDGLETLREIRRMNLNVPVIVLSGCSSTMQVVEAVKTGANDFLAKPVGFDELGKAIHKLIPAHQRPDVSARATESAFLAEEAAVPATTWLKRMDWLLQLVGGSDVPVLLQGETGAGKEVLARQIHARSNRADKPFCKVNCAALPSELVESELFGYERGAFTGAFKNTVGKFELANGGTILLDEIGDMDVKLQAKLLQVLQDREYYRLGAKEPTKVDIRVMAATHCDLERMMLEGQFREDLYYRLNVINLRVPALRERKDEIIPLAEHFIQKYSKNDPQPPKINLALKQALLAHEWPGNIRELENAVRKFLVLRDPDLIAQDLRFRTRRRGEHGMTGTAGAYGATPAPVSRRDWPAGPREMTQPPQTGGHRMPASAPPALDPVAVSGGLPPKPHAKLPAQMETTLESVPPSALQPPPAEAPDSVFEKVDRARKQAETNAILAALNATRWNRRQAAAMLKIDYKALLYKMKKLGIGADETAREQYPVVAGA